MELDIEILVEGHGHIHTLRADIPDFPGVVIREDPRVAISQKLDYLRWLRQQIEAGFQEGLPVHAIEASCFPWGNRTSWESCATDECIRLLSLGHFSRTEWFAASSERTTTNFQPSTKCACLESDDRLFSLTAPSDDEVRRLFRGRRTDASHIRRSGHQLPPLHMDTT